MKAKVLKKFIDGKKKCIYSVGEIIEVNKKRYEEINSTANGVLIEGLAEDLNTDDEEGKNEEGKSQEE